jgi:hypothetical protein
VRSNPGDSLRIKAAKESGARDFLKFFEGIRGFFTERELDLIVTSNNMRRHGKPLLDPR